ncbi:hypothetical protein H8R13_01620 [Morganella morganii]|uniref:hypothetical protein n=1 Tax=Morganella morganii TaxID=582 RepID=UPI00164B1E33|nr:hypothetical protein [Morganella morganii]MBC4010447.1 hypothetical protein [Morganella morganii]MCF1264578.1 hypothetical protein [Morganella morganii]
MPNLTLEVKKNERHLLSVDYVGFYAGLFRVNGKTPVKMKQYLAALKKRSDSGN